jgi:hypothetical protein
MSEEIGQNGHLRSTLQLVAFARMDGAWMDLSTFHSKAKTSA